MTGKPLSTMDFALVVSDKKLREHGFSKGDEVLVIAFKPVATNPNDPYTLTNFALVAKVEGDKVLLPAEDNDNMVYTVDPRNLVAVSEDRNAELVEAIRLSHGA